MCHLQKSQRRKQKRQGAASTATTANPFADPEFNADAEQDAFASNWVEDERDQQLAKRGKGSANSGWYGRGVVNSCCCIALAG